MVIIGFFVNNDNNDNGKFLNSNNKYYNYLYFNINIGFEMMVENFC